MIEDKTINIVDMNRKFTELVLFLSDAGQNTSEFMLGNLLPFGESTKRKW